MKNIKKLMCGFTVVSALASAAPIVSSCGCSTDTSTKEHIVSIDTNASILGTEKTTNIYFTLNSPLSDGEKLSYSYELNDQFTLGKMEIKNTVVVIPVTKGNGCTDGTIKKTKIKFTCTKDSTTVWEKEIEETISYYAIIKLNGESDVRTEENEKSYEFKFDLVQELAEGQHINAFIYQYDEQSTEDIKSSVGSVTVDGTTAKATVTLSKTNLSGEDHAKFDLDFYCVDDDGELIWHAAVRSLKLTYASTIIRVTKDQCTITDDGVLTKIDLSKSDANNANTLDLTQSGLENVTSIADNFYENSGKPTTITYLKVNSKCSTFGANAFKGSNLKHIDLSEMPNDAEWFKSGEFGSNSFADIPEDDNVSGITYNSEWSTYKKHRIKSAFYKAGLYYRKWYDITSVSTAQELREALEIGGFIEIADDFVIPATKKVEKEGEIKSYCEEIVINVSSVIDLRGHKISAAAPVYYEEGAEIVALFAIWNNAEVVVEDTSDEQTGRIESDDGYPEGSYQGNTHIFNVHNTTAERYSPSLTICSGTYVGARSIVHNYSSTVYVEGGNFYLTRNSFDYIRKVMTQNGLAYLFNMNGDTFKQGLGNFVMTGGKFYGWTLGTKSASSTINHYFNPANVPEETTKEGTPANFVADGYESVAHVPAQTEEDQVGYYEVVKKA